MHYTISLALRRGNETVCAVLYNPPADEMFTDGVREEFKRQYFERLARAEE